MTLVDPLNFADQTLAVRRSPLAPYRNVRWSAAVGVGPYPLRRPRGTKKLGLHYERRVLDVLAAIYGDAFREQPVISYWDSRGPRRAILDGVLRLRDELLIIEIKLAHTVRVWEQLMDRYLPLVAALEPGATIRPVEICRTYDPAVLPRIHTKIRSLHEGPLAGQMEVLQWRI